MIREIPKVVVPPFFSNEATTLINQLLFEVPDIPTDKVDSILIFGVSNHRNRVSIARCFEQVSHLVKPPRTVYITGGKSGEGLIEAECIHQLIHASHIGYDFRLDREAQNTKENVENSIVLGLRNHESVLFISKIPHALRCRLTLQRYLPGIQISQFGYSPCLQNEGEGFTKDSWIKFPLVRAIVWGEILRIERYGMRGDIAYPIEVEEKISLIKKFSQ